MSDCSVSVILLTLNAGERFREVLKGVFTQTFESYEVIIIDSSSEDNALAYAKNYPVRLFEIPRNEFGHGKTRNSAASIAKGDYVVFLTQDAVPFDEYWLENLIKNFDDPNVVGVFGKQIPLIDSPPPDKFSYSLDYPDIPEIITKNNYLNRNVIFSNVNSAIRKEVLLSFPFRQDIVMSEDMYWANNVITRGYIIYYEPSAQVIHSHIYNLKQIIKLNFLQGVGFRQVYDSNRFMIKNSSTRFMKKIKFLFHNRRYYWIFYVILLDAIRLIAFYLGNNHHKLPYSIRKNLIHI